MLQGVAFGRRRKLNSLLISESTAPPKDETFTDEQYMQNKSKKLETTKEILKDDSPKDNILSEKAVKKIHEADNCELHEIEQRTDKVQCQRWYSLIEVGFQVCPRGGQLNMSEEMLSSIRQNFKQLIADAHMTFQGTRGARHGAQPRQKHHFLAKELMRKIGKKGIYSSILDRFQNDEVFRASQLQHNWTKQWCEYLDYIRTIDISHTASPEQLDRYATLYHFRYDPKQMGRGPIKKPSRLPPNYTSDRTHEQRSRSDSRIKKTSQVPRGSGPREARLAFLALSQF